jgi:hypothetical protein
VESEWVTFPGGELEGKRPRTLCAACRERLQHEAARPARHRAPASPRPLCFQCYRAELDRDRALKAAGELDTATEARFQCTLPFEAVNRARLERLRAQRGVVRAAEQSGAGQYVDRRRHAQIAARHALQRIAAGLKARSVVPAHAAAIEADAIHAAELQLPDAWLPFVVSR